MKETDENKLYDYSCEDCGYKEVAISSIVRCTAMPDSFVTYHCKECNRLTNSSYEDFYFDDNLQRRMRRAKPKCLWCDSADLLLWSAGCPKCGNRLMLKDGVYYPSIMERIFPEQFEDVLKGEGVWIVLFVTADCMHRKLMQPIIEEIIRDNKQMINAYCVDEDTDVELLEMFPEEARNLGYISVYMDGKFIYNIEGLCSKAELIRSLEQNLPLQERIKPYQKNEFVQESV